MLRNQKGDALTLAMGAAVFVGISVMVTIAVLSNMNAKVHRSRMVNDVEGVLLYINQILNNRDLCAYALRQGAGANEGQAIIFPDYFSAPPAAPPVPKTDVPIPRIYLTNAVAANVNPGNPIYCAGVADGNGDGIPDPDPSPDCDAANARLHNMVIRGMTFRFRNDINGNQLMARYRGATDRYHKLTGELEVDIDFNEKMVLGGDLKKRGFPLQIIVDRTGDPLAVPPIPARSIAACYTRESPALICSQLGGTFNQVEGVCDSMFGLCGVEPNRPSVCQSFPENTCVAASGLKWTTVYFPSTVEPGMRMQCNCMKVCTWTGVP